MCVSTAHVSYGLVNLLNTLRLGWITLRLAGLRRGCRSTASHIGDQGAHSLPPLVRLAGRVHADDDAAILVALVQHDLTCGLSAARRVNGLHSAMNTGRMLFLQSSSHPRPRCGDQMHHEQWSSPIEMAWKPTACQHIRHKTFENPPGRNLTLRASTLATTSSLRRRSMSASTASRSAAAAT